MQLYKLLPPQRSAATTTDHVFSNIRSITRLPPEPLRLGSQLVLRYLAHGGQVLVISLVRGERSDSTGGKYRLRVVQ